MAPVDDVIEDLDDALKCFTNSIGSADAERRTLRTALACIYELRVYREGDGPMKEAYHSRAALSDNGRITEGLVWLRGKSTHFLMRVKEPEVQVFYPGPNAFPGKDTFPDGNVVWRPAGDIASPPPSNKQNATEVNRRKYYEEHAEGQPVLEGLHHARDFLVNDPGPIL